MLQVVLAPWCAQHDGATLGHAKTRAYSAVQGGAAQYHTHMLALALRQRHKSRRPVSIITNLDGICSNTNLQGEEEAWFSYYARTTVMIAMVATKVGVWAN